MLKIINLEDKNYPDKLKNTYDPPQILYCIGNIDLLNKKSFAVIGSRECSKYGEYVAKKIGRELIKKDITVISGLARGIDACSHIGALDEIYKYKTNANIIAVLGSGFKNIYPRENIILANEIIKNNGLIISEHSPIITAKPEYFPKRNRIISALSDGIIVVEAKEKSGTYSTVDFALEQNKEVYVVPGNITSKYSVGTNELIKQGAMLFTKIEDLDI